MADASDERAIHYRSDQRRRRDFFVQRAPGLRLFVREVRGTEPARGVPLLLLHGARVPGVASFDLDVPGGSLAADLAQSGRVVYLMDAHGYGFSTRPAAMAQPRTGNPPLARAPQIVRDVAAVVEAIVERTGSEQVALFGWATGGTWLGLYATLSPERVSHLITHNTLLGATPNASVGAGSSLEDPDQPGRFDFAGTGAYTLSAAASLLRAWDASIPGEDKTAWRDPAVADAYVAAALASDATAEERTPPSFRAPAGALEDSYYLGTGRQLWDGSLLRCSLLISRGGRDFWSAPGDPERLAAQAVHAAEVRRLEQPEATHFVHLDRPERGRAALLDAVRDFLEPAPPA